MAALPAGGESCSHARLEQGFPLVRDQHDFAFEHVDEFILPLMPVPKRGSGAGLEPSQIDAEVPKAAGITQGSFLPTGNNSLEWLGVGTAPPRRHIIWIDHGRRIGRWMVAHANTPSHDGWLKTG